MDEETKLGLSVEWWIDGRFSPRIRRALTRSLFLHCWPQVTDALRSNKANNREPSSREALAIRIQRNLRNLDRWRSGQNQMYALDFLAIPLILKIPTEQFLPTTHQWLTSATTILCGDSVQPLQAEAYVLYRMAGAASCDSPLNAAHIDFVFRKLRAGFHLASNVEQAICLAARAVGRALTAEVGLLDLKGVISWSR